MTCVVLFGVVALVLGGSGVAAPVSGADAPRLVKSYRWLSTTCVPAAADTVRAAVKVRMTVVNYDGIDGDWARAMKVRARLVSTSAGLNYTRSWKEAKTPYLAQNRRHAYVLTVVTDNLKTTADWSVQVKLVWDRPALRDVVVDLKRALRSCGGVGVDREVRTAPGTA